MTCSKSLKSSFERIHKKAKENPDLNEEALKRYFYKEGILEKLGYGDKDIRVEKGVKGKRTDIHCLDDFKKVVFVIEFKKPSVRNLNQHFGQLWDLYVKPLKAEYGILTNGLELLLYERINSNYERRLRINLAELSEKDCKKLCRLLRKPAYKITKIDQVLQYFDKFDHPEEKVSLVTEESREHFFENFKLEKDSAFTDLVLRTMHLFDYKYEKSKFLTSAYDFWEKSYAKEPEEIPKNWEKIMKDADLEVSKESLFKFMFCLETTYALFTRLILAKACEDYKFPSIDFSDFIKTEVKRESYHMEISQASWAVLVYRLIENMRFKLVESIFEEDIFYWWVDDFRDLRGRELFSRKKLSREMILFGESLAKLLMTLYKFDFSEIVGDPLGTLYQKYFDKKTRKALGEFYTPKEVVEYIEDAVDYNGRKILDKRLLDPACGSGTFLVEALKRYLKASEPEAEEKGWNHVLGKLCNEYLIVGFDIHPFATIMAQIQFMLVLIPYYKKAMGEERSFILKRIPIFRTDSLVDESKSERMTLKAFEGSARSISMRLELPIKEKEGEFVKREFVMPYYKEVLKHKILDNTEEYFSAFQALFDVVKENAKEGKYSIEREQLERTFKEYLEDKNWKNLSQFFKPYGNQLLAEIKTLKHDFGDGRLVKSIEDVMLASILKNYVKYDFVVENPPYVRVHNLPEKQKEYLEENYESAYGQYDLYVLFMERSIKWLDEGGKFGLIVSSKFTSSEYGKKLREFILNNSKVEQIVDVSTLNVFRDASIYPFILILQKEKERSARDQNKIKVALRPEEIEFIDRNLKFFDIQQSRYSQNRDYLFDLLSKREHLVIQKLEKNTKRLGEIAYITRGFRPPPEDLVFEKLEAKEDSKPYIIGEDIKGPFCFLEPSRYVKYDKNRIPESKPPTVFEVPKIFVRDIGLRASACYDISGLYCLKTIYIIEGLEHEDFSLKALTAVLNSKITEYFFKAKFWSSHIGGGYLRFRKQYLDLLPIPITIEKETLKELESLVDKMMGIDEIQNKIKNFPQSYVENLAEEFTKKTITFQSSHKEISVGIQEAIDSGYNISTGKKEEPIYVDTKEKAEYVRLALEGKSVKKGEKLEILVPKSNSVVKEILKDYTKDKKRLEKGKNVEDLEEEINKLVYELYGLDKKDQKVIEEFLGKF